jgi:transcriptional regulator GlxA family with amidase domain
MGGSHGRAAWTTTLVNDTVSIPSVRAGKNPVGGPPSSSVIAEVLRYIGEHLASVTAAGVGREVGWSERTLRRRFAAATGMTWRRYLLQSRLLRAMALLAEPGPTVLDVATRVGFDSPTAFARSFRSATGQTPSEYRRRTTS